MRRTFGWVQNPNVLKTLKNVVASIVVDSEFNKHLRKNKLPLLLSILSDGKKYTKFEIGERLGFSGEMGFTSIPQNLFIAELCSTSSPSEKTKIRSNEEGDSDKYARTIARWLEQMIHFVQYP